MKLRSLHFRRGMNISNFVTDLRNTINEFYNINDVKAVDLIAISHVTTSLDEELREPIRILQLSGTATLQGILELIHSKQRQHCLYFCLLVIYLFEQVEVLAAIKLMWTCFTHPYTHKGQPQHRELHALLFSNGVRVL